MADCLFIAINNEFLKKIEAAQPFYSKNLNWELVSSVLTQNDISLDPNTIDSYATWIQSNPQKNVHILRQLAVAYIKQQYEENYKERYKIFLRRAFIDFVSEKNKTQNPDDTFVVHPHIKEQFETLYGSIQAEESLKDLDIEEFEINDLFLASRETLNQFWDNQGHTQYFETLSGTIPEDLSKYSWTAKFGSDLEYDAICQVFGIRGNIYKSGYPYPQSVGIAYGQLTIPTFTQQELKDLRNRGVGDFKGTIFQIEVENKDTLERKLNRIDHYNEILAFLNDNKETVGLSLSTLTKYLKNQGLETEINAITEQLKSRNIITDYTTQSEAFIKNSEEKPDYDAIINRLGESPKKELVLAAHRETPAIFLSHGFAHWSSTPSQPQKPTQKEVTPKTAVGLEAHDDSTLKKALQPTGSLKDVVESYEETDTGHHYTLTEPYGKKQIEHTIQGNRYALYSQEIEGNSVLGLMRVIAASGIKKVEISGLVDFSKEDEVIAACTAAVSVGLTPCKNRKPINLSQHGSKIKEESNKSWATLLLSNAEKDKVRQITIPSKKTTTLEETPQSTPVTPA